MKGSQKTAKSTAKMAVAVLLASTAAGCSSDATRFSGIFSGTDQITTASIPQRNGSGAYGQAPVPRGDVDTGGAMASAPPQGGYGAPAQDYGQSYPSSGGYGASASPARVASAPVAVQRAELTAPAPAASSRDAEPATRREAMSQQFPNRQEAASGNVAAAASRNSSDGLTTGTVKPMSGWSTVNAPQVTMRPGETAATLANRYGVPEKEILRANGGKVAPGQIVTIPTFGPARNSAKTAAADIDLQNKAPAPVQQQEQKVAVLPSGARDKAQAEAAKLTPPSGGKPVPPSGGYVVKAGDSLNKIARETGVSVAQLKAANGLSAENIRIGQTLKLPGADSVQTASIPQNAVEKPAATPKAAAAPAQAAQAPAKPPVETVSLSDVEKKADVTTAAPSSTGIGKYRWPVSGAVVAGYGQNVNGSRNDGIDISVPEGTPIKAAENGVVIYAGNGLKQLGNTVLVRHDDGKVTVYGHAGNLNVTRGQKVTRGQTLAASGMSGDAKRPQVHFEVRKDATPVNPITFLE
jgi:murein DD-endopeptidase MepM/ murein hydrolase activator NlpD